MLFANEAMLQEKRADKVKHPHAVSITRREDDLMIPLCV